MKVLRQTLGEAGFEMRAYRVSALAVLGGDDVVGFISARDLLSLEPRPERLPVGEPW
jgi:CBS domain-containing protein